MAKAVWPPRKLVWVDIETTGLDPVTDVILEVGVVVTDTDLKILAGPNSWVINPGILPEMDGFVLKMHTENGLLDEMNDPDIAVKPHQANNYVIKWLRTFGAEPSESPMFGSSVHFDRKFLNVHYPEIEEYFHYRNFDVSTLKCAHDMWDKTTMKPPTQKKAHRAAGDVLDTLREAHAYKDIWFAPLNSKLGDVTLPFTSKPGKAGTGGTIAPGSSPWGRRTSDVTWEDGHTTS